LHLSINSLNMGKENNLLEQCLIACCTLIPASVLRGCWRGVEESTACLARPAPVSQSLRECSFSRTKSKRNVTADINFKVPAASGGGGAGGHLQVGAGA